jgi:imidazolonepropionase-like amidohydrolase
MPGFRGNEQGRLPSAEPYIITDRDAAEAARKGIDVVTTLQGGAALMTARGPVERHRFDSLHVANLRTLVRHHVTIAIGSDNYRETSVPEANYLHELGVFTNAELLRIWAETTPRIIFPKRRIGRLADGYEASFLGLEGNPLDDFANTGRIGLRVKQGAVLP